VLDRGTLVQLGTPQQIYENPASSYVAARLGSPRINLVPRAALPSLAAPERAATVGVRAEHLRLHHDGAGYRQRAHGDGPAHRAAEATNTSCTWALHGADVELIRRGAARGAVRAGRLRSRIDCCKPLWFDASGQRIAA